MSKATQCAEALQAHFIVQCRNKRRGPLHKAPVDEIADFILRFYPEEQGCTYQKDTETTSLRMIDEGRDV